MNIFWPEELKWEQLKEWDKGEVGVYVQTSYALSHKLLASYMLKKFVWACRSKSKSVLYFPKVATV